MDGLGELVVENPLVAFTTLLLVSLTLPPLFERLRLPGLVGLLFAGVVLGLSLSGGLAVSNVTHQVIDTLTCSVVLFGEPHS